MFEISNKIYKDDYLKIEFINDIELFIPVNRSFEYKLSIGDILSDDDFLKLKNESDIYLCNKKALSYIALRSRSFFELKKYLRKKKFPEPVIEIVMERFQKNGYIDDYSFTLSYINSRMIKKNLGKNILKKELFQRGISKEIIDRAIIETGSDKPDMEELFRLAEKKYMSLNGKNNIFNRLYAFLLQRGFDSSDIIKVINRLKKTDSGSDTEDYIYEE